MNNRARWPVVPAIVSGAALAVAMLTLIGYSADVRLGLLRLRTGDPTRALALAALAAAALLAVGWRARGWRRIGLSLLAICALLPLPMLTRGAAPLWPVADVAMIEIDTLHATHGAQLLGPYSQYGWFHPGPLLFYWFAPFYAIGGHTTASLGTGALALNLLSLTLIGWFTARRESADAVFATALWVLLAAYLWRLPALVTSVWNPHVPVLPFAALLFVTASAVGGNVHMLPLLVLLASFVAQSHVGYAPVAVGLATAGAARAALDAWRQPDRRPSIRKWTLFAAVVLEAAWLLPIAEELASHPGNLTQLWRFFTKPAEPQQLVVAWRVWGGTLAGVFDPAFTIALGLPWSAASAIWPSILGTGLAACLLPAMLSRQLDRYHRGLAATAVIASGAGFWSVLHIRGLIGDYHAFWLSVLGVVNAAIAAGWLAAVAARRPVRMARAELVGAAGGAAVVCAMAIISVRAIVEGRAHVAMTPQTTAARTLTEGVLGALASTGGRKPLVRIDQDVWDVGAGVVLQLAKASVPLAVDGEPFFGRPFAPTGEEDLLVVIAGRRTHAQLAAIPAARAVAEYDRQWFADFVPIQRPAGLPHPPPAAPPPPPPPPPETP